MHFWLCVLWQSDMYSLVVRIMIVSYLTCTCKLVVRVTYVLWFAFAFFCSLKLTCWFLQVYSLVARSVFIYCLKCIGHHSPEVYSLVAKSVFLSLLVLSVLFEFLVYVLLGCLQCFLRLLWVCVLLWPWLHSLLKVCSQVVWRVLFGHLD